MKKTIALILTLAAVMMLFTVAVPADAKAEFPMYVDTPQHGTLTLRQSESTSATAVMLIPYKAKVTVIENHGSWSYVTYDNLYGYVLTRYLSFNQPTGTPAVETVDTQISYRSFKLVTPRTVTVKANRPGGYVNLRWAPDTAIAVLEKVYDGTQLTVIAEGKSWYQVQDPKTGAVGFMMAKFLQ